MGPQGVRVLGSQEPARDRAAAWRKVRVGQGLGGELADGSLADDAR